MKVKWDIIYCLRYSFYFAKSNMFTHNIENCVWTIRDKYDDVGHNVQREYCVRQDTNSHYGEFRFSESVLFGAIRINIIQTLNLKAWT